MRKNKDIGFIRKILLQLITKLQENALKSGFEDIYFRLVFIHFYIYFGKTIKNALDDNKRSYEMAAHRNALMRQALLSNIKQQHITYNTVVSSIILRLRVRKEYSGVEVS